MSFSHPRQFAFQRYEYAARDRYHDYYGIVLRDNMGGFAAGTRFEAGSVRHDGAIHARSGGRIYFLGRMNLGEEGSSGQSFGGDSSADQDAEDAEDTAFGSDMGADGADQQDELGDYLGSNGAALEARRGGSQGGRWTFSVGGQCGRGGSQGYELSRGGSQRAAQRWTFSAGDQGGRGGSQSYGLGRGGSQGSYGVRRGGSQGGRWTFSTEEGGQESSYGGEATSSMTMAPKRASQGTTGNDQGFTGDSQGSTGGSQGMMTFESEEVMGGDDFDDNMSEGGDDMGGDDMGGPSGSMGGPSGSMGGPSGSMGGPSGSMAYRAGGRSNRYSCGAMRCGAN
jgi:hypothetical protein